MWQPVFKCGQGCKGCYVEASESALYEGPFRDDILTLVYESRQVACDQFTVSLDPVNPESKPQYKASLNSLQGLWGLYGKTSVIALPDLCVTAYNWNSVLVWARALGLTPEEFLKPLGILSLSNFPVQGKKCSELQELCKKTNTTLNYNYMVQEDLEQNSFNMGARYADQIYLVLQKSALGQEQSPKALKSWIKVRKNIKEQYPNKLIEDACVMDSLHYNHTQKPCGAGSKKVHVWPDATVTACPYDSHHIRRGKNNTKEMFLEELQAAIEDKPCPAIGFCKIPKALEVIARVDEQNA